MTGNGRKLEQDAVLTPAYRPLYLQIREAFTRRMASGDWSPGMLLPSEMALAQEYGVSQGTIRKALDAMAADRMIVRHQGRGTEVARHDDERALHQFFHIVAHDGRRQLPVSTILSCIREQADADTVEALALQPGAAVVSIRRLRSLSDQPVMLDWIHVPAQLFPGLEHAGSEIPNAVYELFQKRYRISVQRALERLLAVPASPGDADLLAVEPGTPLLEIRRTAFDLADRPVEYRVSRCLTSHHHYRNDLN